jgi:hypothetical protein
MLTGLDHSDYWLRLSLHLKGLKTALRLPSLLKGGRLSFKHALLRLLVLMPSLLFDKSEPLVASSAYLSRPHLHIFDVPLRLMHHLYYRDRYWLHDLPLLTALLSLATLLGHFQKSRVPLFYPHVCRLVVFWWTR